MIPIAGFSPDLDRTTPGILTDCSMLQPTQAGYRSASSAVTCGLPALSSACLGATMVRKTDGTKRIFAGTATALYEQSGSTWSNVTRSSAYTAGTDNKWRFAQFGDVTIATDLSDVLQASSTGAFADLTSPKAALIETLSGFVIVANTVDGTYGTQGDRWWCSGLYDHTTWTPSVSTQCTTGRLVETPGNITALKRLGSNLMAYKDRSLYIGTYAGAPVVWQWQLIPGEIGAPCNEAVVNIGSAHIFVGPDDFYLFDGTRPQSIGQSVRRWFFKHANPLYLYKIIGTYDRTNFLVSFYYVSSTSTTIDSCITYHWPTGKWGNADRSIEACLEYSSAGTTYDGIGSLYSTYDSLPAISFDSPFWTSGAIVPAVVDTTHTLMQLSGIGANTSLTTGDFGDVDQFTTLTRVTPKFTQTPTSATLANQYCNVLGDPLSSDSVSTLTNGRFDFIRQARWHRATIATVGDMEITALAAKTLPGGAF